MSYIILFLFIFSFRDINAIFVFLLLIKTTIESDTAVTAIKNSDIKELHNLLLEELEINEQKEILKMVTERLEILSFRKGILGKDKKKYLKS